MAYNPSDVPLGACKIYLNGSAMGYTMGEVEWGYDVEVHETKVDQVAGPIEAWVTGEGVHAKVPLAESTLANIKHAIAQSTDNTTSVTMGGKTGKRMSTIAKLLTLHPIEFADGDDQFDLRIYKAYSSEPITLGFNKEGERILEVMFKGLADVNRADGDMLSGIGDSV